MTCLLQLSSRFSGELPLFVDPSHHEPCNEAGSAFCNREGDPDEGAAAGPREDEPCQGVGHGQDEEQLAADGDYEGFNAALEGLEDALEGDVGAGEPEAEGDDADGGDAEALCLT